MAAQLAREWTGIQQFPIATQNKLFELLTKLKQENVDSLTILVLGKDGVGKSSTVNSIIGEKVAAITPLGAFQSEGARPVMVSRSRAGFTLNIIDTPDLTEGGYVNDRALHMIKSFLLNRTVDVLLYVDRLDDYRIETLDKQIIKAITDGFGKAIWNRAAVELTHAQLSPPDELSYEEFVAKRSETLLRAVGQGARIKKQDCLASSIPVVLVENSGRCSKSDGGEKVLPDGVAWIPNLFKVVIDIVSNGSSGILVNQRLIERPDPNERGKFWMPVILAAQFLLWKHVRGSIKQDVAKEPKPAWELRDRVVPGRKF